MHNPPVDDVVCLLCQDRAISNFVSLNKKEDLIKNNKNKTKHNRYRLIVALNEEVFEVKFVFHLGATLIRFILAQVLHVQMAKNLAQTTWQNVLTPIHIVLNGTCEVQIQLCVI